MFFRLAFRNLWSRKIKVIVIGSVIVFGSILAVVGGSLVESISNGMRKSITNSISGDIQLYSAKGKEKLSIAGGPGGNFPDAGQLTNYVQIKEALLGKVPNIKALVPQGIELGMLNPGNILDIKLAELRNFKGTREEEEALKEHIRSIIMNINETYYSNLTQIGEVSQEDLEADMKHIKRALSPNFWNYFKYNRNDALEFLENKIAPLIYDDNMFFFLYMGTIPEDYFREFPLAEIVQGTKIPEGKRGFLFNETIYEEQIKHKVAFRLDKINEEITKNKKTIKDEKDLQDKIKANLEQIDEIYNQMNPLQTKALVTELKEFLSIDSDNIKELLPAFLSMNDDDFAFRYKFFYDHIAPKIILYKVKVGDIFPLKTFTKSGYANSVNLKVYGVFRYKNFEDTPLAGNYNIMDIISFRDLYGYMTEEKKAESLELKKLMEKSIGNLDVDEEDMESIFSGEGVKITESSRTKSTFEDIKIARRDTKDIFNYDYSQKDMEDGVCLSIAVILKDYRKTAQTLMEIERISEEQGLGIKAIDWKDSAGVLGQFIFVIKAVLYSFIAIIFIVAIFIIMNSMLMATMERTREIGTMRAIGAKRSYVLKLILAETFLLSSIFGSIGVVLGLGIVQLLNYFGIPAPAKVFIFLFSGPKLHPTTEPIYIVVVLIIISLVSLLSSFYPAYKATKISPLEAMQRNE